MDGNNIVQRYNESLEKKIYKLTVEHFFHFRHYVHASLEEKNHHFQRMSVIWKQLVSFKSTAEAHRLAHNYACKVGKISGVGIPR